MKHILLIMAIATLLLTACGTNVIEPETTPEETIDYEDPEVEEDILPELIEEDEDIEIGDMI